MNAFSHNNEAKHNASASSDGKGEKSTRPFFVDNRPEAADMKTVQQAADSRPRQVPSSFSPPAIVQRRLLFDAGDVAYSLEGGGQDYAYVGAFNGKNRYVKYEDLALLKTAATTIWNNVKAIYGTTGHMKKIKKAEQTNDFSADPELAPGEEKYEKARREKTSLYLTGTHAPGKNFYRNLVEQDGAWEYLFMYYADNENDELASTMTAVNASDLVVENYNLFEGMFNRIMVNQGEPLEKNKGGGADRTSAARGSIYILEEDEESFNWQADDNSYKDILTDPIINSVADLSDYEDLPGAVILEVGGLEAVYVTEVSSKERTGKKFYINGTAYTRSEIVARKDTAEITGPWNDLQSKTPTKQEARTFTRKDRGKGQAHAMGKWSANAAIVASNIIDGTDYNEAQAWEWLHLRGAGLGGATEAGNLVPGTFSSNSEMIPIENKIKNLKSNPDVRRMEVDIEPKDVDGAFADYITMELRVDYNGILDRHTGTWEIDPFRGIAFDKIHEKKLKDDLEGRVDQRIIGSDAVLEYVSGEANSSCFVLNYLGGTNYNVVLEDDSEVVAERLDSGNFRYDDTLVQDVDMNDPSNGDTEMHDASGGPQTDASGGPGIMEVD